ncbi:class I SAM-dependent methyltransferase [Paraburkholderia sp. 40]|uniref:class I SAM-dependent methyltransferase n=1 Tax=Paraburkholderia sp. 40 TaxID=2991059 RepID=UPI003D257D65
MAGTETARRMNHLVTPERFNEAAYLQENRDIAHAVKIGQFKSGLDHYEQFGHSEVRFQRGAPDDLASLKVNKLARIGQIVREDMPVVRTDLSFDFLTPELRSQFNIIDTDVISSNEYDDDVLALIDKHQDGLVLDCGAGSRSTYYQNVVNFEIAAYPSTDVRGVGEKLPFKDHSFDAVVSVAVLEHVKDPWACANEILRVLKPGGDLMVCVPFLQPLHGYPHHYYNMSGQGLRNLFGDAIEVRRHEVPYSVTPIWTLTWILQSWADGLRGSTLDEFKKMRVSDFLDGALPHIDKHFVTELSQEKNMELASATVIHAVKV